MVVLSTKHCCCKMFIHILLCLSLHEGVYGQILSIIDAHASEMSYEWPCYSFWLSQVWKPVNRKLGSPKIAM